MKLSAQELAFLSAWAREEKAANPYLLPAHQLQATHRVSGVPLIRAIKAWARGEGRSDEEIFKFPETPNLSWPWSSEEEMTERLTGAGFEVPLSGHENRERIPQ